MFTSPNSRPSRTGPFILLALLAFVAVFAMAWPATGQEDKKDDDKPERLKVAVWLPFSANDADLKAAAERVTTEFESALVEEGTYEVIHIFDDARLGEALQNIENANEVQDLPAVALGKLEEIGLDYLIFGDVFDDAEGGEVVISATLQGLDRRKIRSPQVSMNRAAIKVPEQRREKVAELVKKLAPVQSKFPIKRQTDGLTVTIESIRHTGGSIVVSGEIVSPNRDRTGYLGRSTLWDDHGIEFDSQNATIGQEGRNSQNLIADIPVEFRIEFPAKNEAVKSLSRLDIKFGNARQHSAIQLRNVPVTGG